MTTQKQASSKGRPQLTPVERELREAARRLKDLNKIRGEFNGLLSLDERSEEDAQEIRELAEKRREICRAIDQVSNEVKKAREMGDKQKEAKGKVTRKELYDSLNALPELGYTEEDWKSAPASMKAKELGRPKLRIEQQLNRAEDAFLEQEGILRKVEEEHGVPPARIRDHIEEAVQPNVGRPRLGPLDRLDRDLIKTEEEIEHIESGKAQKEQDAMIQARLNELDLTDPADLPGRPPVPMSVRLERLEEKREEILSKIREHERKMTQFELVGREIDVMKLRMRALKRKMKKEGDPGGEMAKRHEAMMSTLESLEASERKLREKEAQFYEEPIAQAPQKKASPVAEKASAVEKVAKPAPAEDSEAVSKKESEAVKERARKEEKQKIESQLTSMQDTLENLLEDIDMSITSESNGERPKRSRLKDRLLANASNG